MGTSCYTAIATSAPVLLLGATLMFRSPENPDPGDPFTARWLLLIDLIGIVGSSASWRAPWVLRMSDVFGFFVDELMFWSLVWLAIAKALRVATPFIDGMKIVGLHGRRQKLEKRLLGMADCSGSLETSIDQLEECIDQSLKDGDLERSENAPTRLLATEVGPGGKRPRH